jgi:hypothetical protein
MALGQQDIVGLYVAVHYTMAVGVVECISRFPGDGDCACNRQLGLAVYTGAERLAGDVWHGEPELADSLARVQNGEYVRVLQPGRDVDLALEALGAKSVRQIGVEDLEGYGPVVPEVVGKVDHGHSTPAELSLDAIAVGQRGFKGSTGV